MRALGLALALAVIGCGAPQKEAKGRMIPGGARIERDLDPADVLPADLDLVVRLDLSRMRDALGPTATEELSRQALRGAREPELAEALGCAEVVWIGARATDIEAGDRVLVIEGKRCMPELSASRWEKIRSGNRRLLIFDRRGEAPRAGTARIMNIGDHATVFVSPVELDSVKRLLDAGPDAARGNPRAEGALSVDLRPRPLPPALARRYPSITAVLGGIERVRATAALGDDGVRVDAEVVGKSAEGAAKAARFLEAMRESLRDGKFGEAVKGAKVETVEKTVAVKVVLPAKLLVGELGGGR